MSRAAASGGWGRGGLSPPPISVEMASFRQKSGASGHGQLQSEVGGEAMFLEVGGTLGPLGVCGSEDVVGRGSEVIR